MKLTVAIASDNDAFSGSAVVETARILRDLADKIERGHDENIRLYDINGNVVGAAHFVPSEYP